MTNVTGESLTTVVLVDVEGTTGLVDPHGEGADAGAVLRQLDVVRDRLPDFGGSEVKSLGGGLLLAFGSPRRAVAFAVACQRSLGDSRPGVRFGVHTGEVLDLDDDHLGGTVNASARIVGRAEGGEVLVSDVVRQLVGADPVVRFVDRGRVRLRGFSEPWQLWAAVDLSSGPTATTTIGRGTELVVFGELLAALATGSGRSVFIEGEAGIGKSHLLSGVAAAALSAGISVLEVAADEVVRRPGEVAHALGADERLAAGVRSKLRELLAPSVLSSEVEDRSYAVIEQCADGLEMLTRSSPVLMVVEDLHWADDLSLGVIRAVVQRTMSSRLAVVGALRPVPRPTLLDRLLDTVVTTGGQHLWLGPLDDYDVQALAAALTGAAPGPRLRDRLLATGGNPLFVSELLRAFDDEQQLRVVAGVAEIAESSVPGSLGATLLRRSSSLPAPTRDLLRLASLLGSSFTLSELGALTGRAVVDVATWLRDATQAGLVVGDGERLRFRHDLVREAVYEEMLPAERRSLHRAAGEALARTSAPLQQIAQQFLRGATEGDAVAAGWLLRAADELVPVAPRAAIDLFEDALAVAPLSWPERSSVQAKLIEPLAWCGRFDAAEEMEQSVRATAPDSLLAFEVERGMSAVHGHRGDVPRSIASLHAAADIAGAPEDEARHLRCFSAHLEVLLGTTSLDDARQRSEEELAEARERGDATGQCVAHQVLGTVESVAGRYASARDHLQRATTLHDSGHVRSASYLIPDIFLAGAQLYLDDADACLRTADHSRRVHAERGALSQLPLCHAFGAGAHFLTGAWQDAEAEIDAGLTFADETASRNFVLFFRSLLARIATGRGQLAEAERHIQQGFDELARGSLYGADWLLDAQAALQTASGDTGAALVTAELRWTQTEHLRYFYGHRDSCELLTRIALANDRLDLAIAAVECLEESANRTPVPSAIGAALQARGLLDGDASLLAEALGHLRPSPWRPQVARCCEDLGRHTKADGNRGDARRLLEEAGEIFESVGADGDVARVDDELRRLGGRSASPRTPRPTFGWESLTPMELTVSKLVAEGLTNPEIGQQLHISRRTVESHLSHTYRKMDLATRAQLAAEVVRRSVV